MAFKISLLFIAWLFKAGPGQRNKLPSFNETRHFKSNISGAN